MSAGPLTEEDLWCEESEEESGEYEDEDSLAEGTFVGDGTGRPKANLTAYDSAEYKVRLLWNGQEFCSVKS